MKLNIENVGRVFSKCMYKNPPESAEEIPTGSIIAEGIRGRFVFDPKIVESNKKDIKDMLSQLTDQMSVVVSFLNLPVTSKGEQWGEQFDAEKLMVLGIAAGYIKYVLPAEQWKSFPGGMPMLILSFNKMEVVNEDKRKSDD